MAKKIEKGNQYNNFTVLKLIPNSNERSANGQPYYLCQCICGVEREVRQDNLGKVKGCGCQRKGYQNRRASNCPKSRTVSNPVRIKTKPLTEKRITQEQAAMLKTRRRIEELKELKALEEYYEY